MSRLDYIIEPMADDTWLRKPGARRQSLFRVDWAKTQADLADELDAIGAREATVELGVLPGQLRRDRTGLLAGQYAPPGVVLSFERRDAATGDWARFAYRNDAWVNDNQSGMASWRHNLRAIGLTLEAQRATDRWGASGAAGGTYGGFLALGAGPSAGGATALGGPLSLDEAWERARVAVGDLDPLRRDAASWRMDRRRVVRAAHPDTGADPAEWALVEPALVAIDATFIDAGEV